jgi:hypothetical protein
MLSKPRSLLARAQPPHPSAPPNALRPPENSEPKLLEPAQSLVCEVRASRLADP